MNFKVCLFVCLSLALVCLAWSAPLESSNGKSCKEKAAVYAKIFTCVETIVNNRVSKCYNRIIAPESKVDFPEYLEKTYCQELSISNSAGKKFENCICNGKSCDEMNSLFEKCKNSELSIN